MSSIALPAYADQFMLRPDMTFLNHGSFGACPRPVFEVYQQWQRELEAQPVEFLGRRISGLLREARAALGAYLGASGDDLAFVPNATHGVNIVARSLDLQPGDEVLASDHEYGAVDRTWRFICGQRGATYRTTPVAVPFTDAETIVNQLWQGVTPRTKAIVVSHLSSPTALTFPVVALCARARAAGILTIIDGAHAPGQIELDLQALGADFYTGNCHKWLCAPKGAGFLYTRPERQALLVPLIVSWGWESLAPSDSPFVDYFEWTGTADPAAYLSVPAAIAFQQERDWPAVRTACHALVSEARRAIAALSDAPQLCAEGKQWYAQMASIPLPPCQIVPLKKRLWDEYRIEVPLIDWGGRQYVRVSIQAYNKPEDVERLVNALRESRK
jgi:isopenicillin-N epimerase